MMEQAIQQEEELKKQQRRLRKQQEREEELKRQEEQQRQENLVLEERCASQEEQATAPFSWLFHLFKGVFGRFMALWSVFGRCRSSPRSCRSSGTSADEQHFFKEITLWRYQKAQQEMVDIQHFNQQEREAGGYWGLAQLLLVRTCSR